MDCQQLLESWWQRGGDPTPALQECIRKSARRVLRSRKRQYAIPFDVETEEEIVQETWLSLVQRRDAGDPVPNGYWVDAFVRKIQGKQSSNFALYVAEDSVPEAESSDDLPLEALEKRQSAQESLMASRASIERLASFLKREKERGNAPNSSGKTRAKHHSEDARGLRELIEAQSLTHSQVAEILGVSMASVREVLYRNANLSPLASMRLQDRLDLVRRIQGDWNWEKFLKVGYEETGKSGIAFRRHLAFLLHSSERSVRRWIQHGSGWERGLRRAILVRNRGWKR